MGAGVAGVGWAPGTLSPDRLRGGLEPVSHQSPEKGWESPAGELGAQVCGVQKSISAALFQWPELEFPQITEHRKLG